MPTIFSNIFSLANVATILLTATIDRRQFATAINVQLFAESGCPRDNPGPICTNLPELTCCKDHVGDIAYYYTSAYFEGLLEAVEPIRFAVGAWTWNFDSKCGKRSSTGQGKSECIETDRSYRDGYGAYWAWSRYGYNIPLPTARALVNGSISVGALGEAMAGSECQGSVAPDIYHIKLSPDSLAIPVSWKALEMMAAVGNMERDTDALQVGELVDWTTGVVKVEKVRIVQRTLEKYGDGLTDDQLQALKKLRK